MNRLFLPLSALIILLSPFREGGRDPIALLALHTLALVCVLSVALGGLDVEELARASRGTRRTAALVAAFLLLSLASAMRARYPLAAGLGAWDLCIACGLFLASAWRPASAGAIVALRDLTIASTSLQAVVAIARSWQNGIAAAGASFLNRNHLAAFLNIGILLAVTAAEGALRRRDRRAILLWSGIGGLHAAALALLASRGALLGLGVSLVVLGAVRWRSWTPRVRGAAAGLAILLLAIGGEAILLRFTRAADPYRYHRLRIWTASLDMIGERPLLGFGAGMFRYESANHNFPLEGEPVRFGRLFLGAHSGLLTLAVENGVPAVACLLLAAMAALVFLLRPRPRARGPESLGIGLALLALLAQGVVEDLQERPALTLVPALLVGAALGVFRNREEEPSSFSDRAAAVEQVPRRSRAIGLVIVVAAAYLFCLAIARPFLAYREAEAARQTGRPGLASMERAARLNPLHPEYQHDLAMAELNSPPLTPDRYAEAAIHLLEARRLKPIDYRFPLLLGRLEARAGPRLFSDPTAADRATGLYREAIGLAPLDARPRLELAGHLDGLGRLEEALAVTEKALTLEPNFLRARILQTSLLLRLGRTERTRDALRALGETQAILKTYLPDSAYARELVADAPEERERLRQFVDKGGAGHYIDLSQLLH